jgi:hypothetical protein
MRSSFKIPIAAHRALRLCRFHPADRGIVGRPDQAQNVDPGSKNFGRATLLMTSAALLIVASHAACAAPVARQSAAGRAVLDDARLASVVLAAPDFQSFATVLAAMAPHMPSMRVATDRDCPGITLRSSRAPNDNSAPLVYVDGTRTVGTCALVELSPRDVERVEVYPLGGTTRPGYARSSNGLILIFMKPR